MKILKCQQLKNCEQSQLDCLHCSRFESVVAECDVLWGGVLCSLVEITDILEEHVPIFKPEEG